MKFRFCGGSDCPDWLLMQINSLANLSPIRLQQLCEIVVEPLIGNEMDYTKLREFSKETPLDTSEVKACVSAVNQILKSGSCHGVSPGDLGQELEQLGLDRQHSQVIVKEYSSKLDEIVNKLKEDVLRTGKLNNVSASLDENSGIKLVLSHTDHSNINHKSDISITKEQARLLLAELKTVRNRMEDLDCE